MVNILKLIVVLAMSLCLMGCRKQTVEETVAPLEQNPTTVATEAVSETTYETVYEDVGDEDVGYEGGVLIESTEESSMTEIATEPETETTAPAVTEPGREPEETTGDSAIPDNTDEGDFLDPPAEGSDGVL